MKHETKSAIRKAFNFHELLKEDPRLNYNDFVAEVNSQYAHLQREFLAYARITDEELHNALRNLQLVENVKA